MQLQSTTKVRKSAIHLSNSQKWQVATFCIENKCVIPDPTLNEIKFIWRVKRTQTCKEISEHLFEINENHLDQSINFYLEVCEITKKMPSIPPIQDTVEMDRLTAQNKRLENDIKEITTKFDQMQHERNNCVKKIHEWEVNLKAISKLIPAYIFNLKI